MTANSAVPGRPSRRVILLTKLKHTSMRLGAVTQAFFRKGDELAATEFENVPYDDPMLVPPKLGFRSFDRVPRRRAPALIVLLLLAASAALFLGWLRVRGAPNGTARVAASVESTVSAEWIRLKELVGSRQIAR